MYRLTIFYFLMKIIPTFLLDANEEVMDGAGSEAQAELKWKRSQARCGQQLQNLEYCALLTCNFVW